MVIRAGFSAVGGGSGGEGAVTRRRSVLTFTSSPENSQDTTKKRPLPEKSAWFGPRHVGSFRSLIVRKLRASVNRIVLCCSIITTADLPSGVKYRLYGRGIETTRVLRALRGSIITSSSA